MSLLDLTDKKIAIVGYGTNNQKLADFFTQNEIKFDLIKDWKYEKELTKQLTQFQIIFRTPGLPYLSEPIQAALLAGVEISSQTRLFFELCPAPIIGITGTKGKGTTTLLVAEILAKGDRKVWVAGNIGQDPFEFISQIHPEDLVVLELSSFQLQDLEKSPHVAVVLSITPDHLNHHKDFEEYITAKSNIIRFQKIGDHAILHKTLPEWFLKLGLGQKKIIDPLRVADFKTKLLGQHNWENIAAAVEVGMLFGISEVDITKSIEEFEPLPHRLNVVAEKNGIIYVDDSISTNEESTIAAINTFIQPKILILGGSSKGLNYQSLGQKIKSTSSVKSLILVGEETQKILDQVKGFNGQVLTNAKNMNEIFDQIKSVVSSGDVVLLSPAAASFGMFKDYKDRGDQFVAMVKNL